MTTAQPADAGPPAFPAASPREMCALISEYFREFRGIGATPEQVWNYSPTGELFMVFRWYREALVWREARGRLGLTMSKFEEFRAALWPACEDAIVEATGGMEIGTEAYDRAVIEHIKRFHDRCYRLAVESMEGNP